MELNYFIIRHGIIRKLLQVIILFLLSLGILSSAKAAEPIITGIEISGNRYVQTETILKPTQSKVGDLQDEVTINADMKAIYSLGYFEDVKVSFENYKNGKKVVYLVKENPLIRQIIISGNTVYSTSELKAMIKISENQILSFKFLRDDIDSLQKKYQEDGYILSKIKDVKTDPETETLSISISEGYVQGITIEGTTNTKDYVILRELQTKTGKAFNEKTLKSDLRQVFNLGYFSEINPVFEPGTDPDKVIIILKIKESRTSTVNFGGGYGEREGWFGFIDLAINNLMGNAHNLLVKGQWGQEVSTYQFKYFNPWFLPEKLGDRTSFTARLWNTLGRDIYLTLQDEFHVGWDMTFGKELQDNFRSSFSFGAETVSPRGAASFEAYNSNFIGVSFSYDTRDVWMNPTQGAFHTISLKEGWKQTNSATTNYTKYGLELNRFYPVRENLVYAWHFDTGLGVGDIPLGETYWAGGPNTIRGYSLDEMKTGTRKIILNHEFRYTFNETFQGVVFFDWGNAWNSGLPEPSQFIAGWGPGIRINTPLGPIRLDYGTSTHKGFGEGILHFSIGQTF